MVLLKLLWRPTNAPSRPYIKVCIPSRTWRSSSTTSHSSITMRYTAPSESGRLSRLFLRAHCGNHNLETRTCCSSVWTIWNRPEDSSCSRSGRNGPDIRPRRRLNAPKAQRSSSVHTFSRVLIVGEGQSQTDVGAVYTRIEEKDELTGPADDRRALGQTLYPEVLVSEWPKSSGVVPADSANGM